MMIKGPLQQAGFTVIEVVVSMFILALGIMAMIGMQTRTLGSIQQAENISQVSQAVENLASGVSLNPHLKLEVTPKGYETRKDYSLYQLPHGCIDQSITPFIEQNSQYSKKQFAQTTLKQFCTEIKQITSIDPKDIQLKVCPNSKIESNLSWNFSCQDNGAQTVVKVVWKYKTKIQKPEQKNQQEKKLQMLDENNKVTLSYQVPLNE